jgi:hypothetical protein
MKAAAAERHGHPGGAFRMRIEHRRQHYAVKPGVLAGVVAAEHAGADDAAS